MFKAIFLFAAFCFLPPVLHAEEQRTPHYLYKVISKENWAASQHAHYVQLSDDDSAFIHFSTEEQLPRITSKYWKDVPEYVVLKVDTARLPGNMVFEANPGGTSKYYHLYNGSIPMKAVVEAKIVKN